MPSARLASAVAVMTPWGRALAAVLLVVVPQHAHAAALDGEGMKWPFALPFAGLLLSIAIGPLLLPKLWHAHYGKIAAVWAVLTLASITWLAGAAAMLAAFTHAMLGEYLSFIVLLFALYTVAGGIVVSGDIRGTPRNNAAMLALPTSMASVPGTTASATILVRPLIPPN